MKYLIKNILCYSCFLFLCLLFIACNKNDNKPVGQDSDQFYQQSYEIRIDKNDSNIVGEARFYISGSYVRVLEHGASVALNGIEAIPPGYIRYYRWEFPGTVSDIDITFVRQNGKVIANHLSKNDVPDVFFMNAIPDTISTSTDLKFKWVGTPIDPKASPGKDVLHVQVHDSNTYEVIAHHTPDIVITPNVFSKFKSGYADILLSRSKEFELQNKDGNATAMLIVTTYLKKRVVLKN
jgi:hypothetical protein